MKESSTPRRTPTSETHLVRRAQHGDRRALVTLLREHAPILERLCRSMSRNTVGYDDLLQETYVGILQNLAGFRCEAAFSTWVYTIARTRLARSTRRDTTRSTSPVPWGVQRPAPPQAQPETRLGGQEIAVAIDKALASLSARDRLIVTLFYISQQTLRDVAEQVGLTESATKSRLHRARTALKQRLRPLWNELEAARA